MLNRTKILLLTTVIASAMSCSEISDTVEGFEEKSNEPVVLTDKPNEPSASAHENSSSVTPSEPEGEKLLSFCRNFDYQELENGINNFQNKSTDKINYKWNGNFERELVNDYFEQIIEFKKEVQDEKNSAVHTIYTHNIKLIKTRKGKIVYYKVGQLINVKSNGKWVPSEVVLMENSNVLFDQLKQDFNNRYSEPLDLGGLFITSIVYGTHCGLGQAPEYRVKMNQLVESKDTITMIKWLKSTTIEIQLYAIDGILVLKKAGLKFDRAVIDLIDTIATKEGSAYTCSGCSHWNQPISEIVEGIKKKHSTR